ncbi:hypothetical protein PC116_g21884 [Phytophthora cactorum]|uniref:Uncharacterized protein n=1 Tax=Phytophthora cactorum TaxID=29920 RepID=A0A8T1C3T3_9STRA|nr:hypothetical protein Pcac1_g6832 [Phytophthora cactorum]KAG2883750.1 hypothetical protein PC114_g20441 [Phytophthora cactorum]KAG2912061.1 hypothetical protein PC117_g18991 [Phytophthora cactorum]KAG2986858.1 hypothetical protein PC119_g19795 [Phytophthora cactorum]KAG3004907.1 hypothetical protein PC120_g18291 [Phytophthora cactorum]
MAPGASETVETLLGMLPHRHKQLAAVDTRLPSSGSGRLGSSPATCDEVANRRHSVFQGSSFQ